MEIVQVSHLVTTSQKSPISLFISVCNSVHTHVPGRSSYTGSTAVNCVIFLFIFYLCTRILYRFNPHFYTLNILANVFSLEKLGGVGMKKTKQKQSWSGGAAKELWFDEV